MVDKGNIGKYHKDKTYQCSYNIHFRMEGRMTKADSPVKKAGEREGRKGCGVGCCVVTEKTVWKEVPLKKGFH